MVCALTAGVPLWCGAPAGTVPAPAAQAQAPPLVEAFQKGPISLSGKVIRSLGNGEQATLPLFQVPVLQFKDQLELSFSGEAFDQRVTRANWSLIVVFLPRTIAPTEQGVVDFRLKRKGGRMVIPAISVPYDSIPMLFLIPDKNARKKVLKDLTDHLEAFRTLCGKISEISTERAAADKFIADLDAIDKNLSPAQYDNALRGFVNAYGDALSGNIQSFLSTSSSNLEKCQFLTQEFRDTHVLVPGGTPPGPVAPPFPMAAGQRPVSAYVSIIFDLAAILNNLWPGHQFQYLPAVARDFHDSSADLYYSSWIRTTGDVRGALMCCPGNWEDQQAPAFAFELPAGATLLGKQVLLKARPKENSRAPFALYGHDWKLLLTGPKGESLPPLALTVSPGKQSFVAYPGSILGPLEQLDASQLQGRIVGRWGFASIAQTPESVLLCDPRWTPSAAEAAAFQVGKACTFRLPGTWAGSVERVVFRPSAPGAAVLVARLKPARDGARAAEFEPNPGDAGPGTLEITTIGAGRPALIRPLTLSPAPPEVTGLEARLEEPTLVVQGRHLDGLEAVELGERRFLPDASGASKGRTRVFRAADGKPPEGTVGQPLNTVLVTRQGKRVPWPAILLPARPRIGEVQYTPMQEKAAGLPLKSPVLIASTSDPSQVSLLAAKGYRFPLDPTFRVALRNAEYPAEIRTIPAARIRVMGRNRKVVFGLTPAELLGDRAAGKLEVQVQDDHAGPSAWLPLPPTFLELPTISAIQVEDAGFRLSGQGLDQIEALSADPDGPWEKTAVAIDRGHEVAELTAPRTSSNCYIKLFGWPDLALAVQLPAPPPAPKPEQQDPAPAPGRQAPPQP